MIAVTINGITMSFRTLPSLFSPGGPDAGTLAMLSLAEFRPGGKVLDLGCGWGIAGIYAAKLVGAEYVTMSDIDGEAVKIARENARINGVPGVSVVQSDGFGDIGGAGYALILSNPPYHADFAVAKGFIEKGFNRLAIGGKMLMVTKRREWYKNKFIAVFGGVRIEERGGYFVFEGEKRGADYAKTKRRPFPPSGFAAPRPAGS
ncbi:MAG: methyltransferase [Firmicutes bacterium]|nr:methyltransferase [Bacillota bacterium]